jgi:hypothetical protein
MHIDQQVKPELCRSIPRKAVLKRQALAKRMLRLLLLAPYLFLGIALFCYLLCQSTILIAGKKVEGVITSVHLGRDGVKTSYTFKLHGRDYKFDELVPGENLHLQLGDKVYVKTIPSAPAFMPMLFKPCGNRIMSFFPSLVFAVLWNGTAFLFAWLIYAAMQHEKRIYTHGIAAIAEIKHKSVKKSGGNTDYTIHYTFTVDNGKDKIGTLRWGEDVVSKKDYDTINNGESYTVLYLDIKPLRSVLYQFGPYNSSPS